MLGPCCRYVRSFVVLTNCTGGDDSTSAPVPEADAATPEAASPFPVALANYSGKGSNLMVVLNWEMVPEQPWPDGFRIYRSEAAGDPSTGQPLATATRDEIFHVEFEFVDRVPQDDRPSFYRSVQLGGRWAAQRRDQPERIRR